MIKQIGFTLIELVIVILLLGIIAAVAIPKFINIKDDALFATMEAMKGALTSARDLNHSLVEIHPNNKNTNNTIFTSDDGTRFRIRGNYPDGRWENGGIETFADLVDFDEVTYVTINLCPDDGTDWCVRHKALGWFTSRQYTTVSNGRGFVIYPQGYNVNQTRCYVYYFTPNAARITTTGSIPVVRTDTSECES